MGLHRGVGTLNRAGEARALTVVLAAAAVSSAASALAPMTPEAPVRINAGLAAVATLLALLSWVRPSRALSHLGLTALVAGLGVLTAAAATPAGTAVLGTGFTWAAAFAAFFLPVRQARGYAAAAVVAFGAALWLNPFLGAVHVWSLTALTAVVAVEAIASLVARLDRAALTDPLTGLLNRNGLQRRAAAALAAADRSGAPLSVAVLDLDGFKAVNDRDGHDAGDRLLRSLAGAWRRELRSEDVLARLGGDEFVLVLPGAGAREAEDLLDRLAAVSVTPWTSGVAAAGPDADLQQLLIEADRALYAAKAARQTVVLPEPRSSRQPGLTPT